jgi:hypothetical protein
VRNRVLSIAGRDKSFGEELVKLGLEKLGSYETHQRYSQLAYQAAKQGDAETAGDYTLKAIETDPTHLGPVQVINEIATKDRAAADRLILQYIDRLRSFPLSDENQSTLRTSYMLNMLVYPRSAFNEPLPNITPPGAAVMRAYVGYEIERFSKLDEAMLRRSRSGLLLVWEPLKRYAPDSTRNSSVSCLRETKSGCDRRRRLSRIVCAASSPSPPSIRPRPPRWRRPRRSDRRDPSRSVAPAVS